MLFRNRKLFLRCIGILSVIAGAGCLAASISATALGDVCVGSPTTMSCANDGPEITCEDDGSEGTCQLPYATNPSGSGGCGIEYEGSFELGPTAEFPSGRWLHTWSCKPQSPGCSGLQRQGHEGGGCTPLPEPPHPALEYADPETCLSEAGDTTISLSQTNKSCASEGQYSYTTGSDNQPTSGTGMSDWTCQCTGTINEENPATCEYLLCSCEECGGEE